MTDKLSMTSPLNPLASNDLFGDGPTRWRRQSALIYHFIQATEIAMSTSTTQLPHIQASFVRAGGIPTSSNGERSAKRFTRAINQASFCDRELIHPTLISANWFSMRSRGHFSRVSFPAKAPNG